MMVDWDLGCEVQAKENLPNKWTHGIKPGSEQECKWKDGIFLVINNNNGRLDSATIPIEWHFTPAFASERPQWIVIIDHPFSLDKLREDPSLGHQAIRHDPVHISTFAKYVQLFSTGEHFITAAVFCGEKDAAHRRALAWTSKNSHGYHEFRLDPHIIQRGYSDTDWNIYFSSISLVVPHEVMSHKPTGGFRKFVWDWTNRWHNKAPIDQCEYRKRMILAFTIQPILFSIGRLSAGLIGTLYSIFGAGLIAFFGWRPISICKNIYASWSNLHAFKWKLNENYHYRDWAKENDRAIKSIPHYLVPCNWALVGVIIWGGISVWKINRIALLATGGVIATFIIVAAIVIAIGMLWRSLWQSNLRKKFTNWMSANIKGRQTLGKLSQTEQAELKYQNELSTIIAPRRKDTPNTVQIDVAIEKADLPTQAKLVFWTTKAKVCKPFAR